MGMRISESFIIGCKCASNGCIVEVTRAIADGTRSVYVGNYHQGDCRINDEGDLEFIPVLIPSALRVDRFELLAIASEVIAEFNRRGSGLNNRDAIDAELRIHAHDLKEMANRLDDLYRQAVSATNAADDRSENEQANRDIADQLDWMVSHIQDALDSCRSARALLLIAENRD